MVIGLIKRGAGRVRRWISGLSRVWVIALASAVAITVVVGSVLMYRAYDFIQHDNEFCNTCHLMSQPFARFNQSAHRGLGCKACHRPNIIQRSYMGMVAVLKNPKEVGRHAPVSNERCGECHVSGDPQEWKLISSSSGHRVHLESNNPAVKGLQCITCHSTSIHEFSTVDKTCARAGCHENSKIQLGKMSNLEVHCAACHDFNRPISEKAPVDSLKGKLSPRRGDCLSCHAMRQRVGEIPPDEPHKGVCGTCHNPHEQNTPQAAVKSCANGACHERVDTVSAFHRGLDAGVLENCTSCHKAHSWKVQSTDCRACHSPASLDGTHGKIAPAPHKVGTMSAGALEMVLLPYRMLFAALQQATLPAPPQKDTDKFSHKQHQDVNCTSCHSTETSHGALKVRTFAECQQCHHSKRNQQRCSECHTPQEIAGTREVLASGQRMAEKFSHKLHEGVTCTSCHSMDPSHGALNVKTVTDCQGCHHSERNRERCTSCHTQQEIAGTRERAVAVKLSVWSSPRTRNLAFAHEVHAEVQCTSCHQGAPSFTTVRSCTRCHATHHEVERTCTSCHAKVTDTKVHDRRVHVTCAGAGCHNAAVLPKPVTARAVCLSCHTQQVNHEPGGDCASCHLIGPKKRDSVPERTR